MRTFGFGAVLLVWLVLLIVVTVVSRVAGFHVSLLGSFIATIVLTIAINLVLGFLSRRRRNF